MMTSDWENRLNTSSDEREDRISQEAVIWFAKKRSAPLSSEEETAFESWRAQSPAHAKAFQDIMVMWADPALVTASRRMDGTQFPERYRSAPSIFFWPRNLIQLGATLGVACIMMLFTWQLDLVTLITADYHTSTGERRTVQLSDQSKVTLSPLSAISVEFTENTRRIRLLKGKAFFDVTSNPARPFVVEHEDFQVQAVGTEFIVDNQQEGFHVTVVEGLVSLSSADSIWAPVSLSAATHIDITHGRPGSIRDIDISAATAWLRGRLIVDTVRLREVIDEVKPYHTGTILLLNSDTGNITVSGTYNLTDTAGILSTLSKTLPIQTLSLANRVTLIF